MPVPAPVPVPAPAPVPVPVHVHRYRASRPWSVAVLAVAAAGGAVLLTGGLSTAFSGAAASASAPVQRGVGKAVAGVAPRAAAPAPPAAGPALAPVVGIWQIQVGAFRNESAARTQLRAIETLVPELASLAEAPQLWGDVTRARFGGIADEAAASRLCGRVIDAGGRCFVVAPGG